MKSKLILTSILFFTWCAPAMVSAQNTNTFPATGNVGIGTTTPQERLDIIGSIRMNGNAVYLAWDRWHGIGYFNTFTTTGNYAAKVINGPVVFGYAGGALGTDFGGTRNIALSWNSDGNVGIGTNTPTEKLAVNGKISIEVPGGVYGNNTLKISENSIEVSRADDREAPLYLNFTGVNSNPVIIGNSINTSDTYLSVAGYINARKETIGGPGIITGDINADYKLAVNGKIVAKSIYVTMTGWGDFVFDKNYQRMSWMQKKNFFETYKHLPGLEKASDIEKNGVNMSETLKNVTINVEENSLDIIDLYQRLEKLEAENIQLKKELISLNGKSDK